MNLVYMHEQREQQAFAEKAAAHFAAHPEHWSYTDGPIEPCALLGLRWGLHNRAVAVLKLDANHQPVIYGDLIPAAEEGPL